MVKFSWWPRIAPLTCLDFGVVYVWPKSEYKKREIVSSFFPQTNCNIFPLKARLQQPHSDFSFVVHSWSTIKGERISPSFLINYVNFLCLVRFFAKFVLFMKLIYLIWWCGARMKGSGSSWSGRRCPRCIANTTIEYHISKSLKNPGRPYYRCCNCSGFVMWAASKGNMHEVEAASHGPSMKM